MRILVVEDDKAVAGFLKKGLEAEQYAVDIASDGEEARFMAEEFDYDLVVLDLNLPRVDGFEVLSQIRAKKSSLPILVLTARVQVKPFSFSELSARVRALLRRSGRPSELVLRIGDLEMDRVERTVKRGGRRIELTPKEFALLEYLMRNVGRRVTRTMIVEHVWNLSFDTMTNVVDVYINYLRKKVDEGFDHKLIQTIRGVGYQLGDTEQ